MFSELALILGGLAAAGCLAGAFFNFRRKRLIDDTPTSKTQGVFIGLTEVKGYQVHENETQILLTTLRGQTEATPPGVAGPDYKGLVPLLRITVERYPDLKANQSFLKLQESLVDTEERIALARDYFNDGVTFYNTRLGIIPDRFVAVLARLQPKILMIASDFERAPVRVNLA